MSLKDAILFYVGVVVVWAAAIYAMFRKDRRS